MKGEINGNKRRNKTEGGGADNELITRRESIKKLKKKRGGRVKKTRKTKVKSGIEKQNEKKRRGGTGNVKGRE